MADVAIERLSESRVGNAGDVSQEARIRESFDQIVLEGARAQLGMGSFGDMLTPEDSKRILGYILYRAHTDRASASSDALEDVAESAAR